ncbi:MAG TPA: pyrroline-5-carboxylate reductase [Beijerinckiaceae bacterium]|nr:pyrroline-5-carboxylate reductase [Beijerinckiaceae bacterium]
MTNWPRSLVLVGAGKMGGAMLEGWLTAGMPGPSIAILDPHLADSMIALAGDSGVRVNPVPSLVADPEVIVLAIKPQMLDAAAEVLGKIAGPQTLVVSVLAGKTIANLRSRMPRARAFIRAMPNTPAAVGRGITGVSACVEVTEAQRRLADRLLSAIGRVEWVPSEDLIDAVTAVSGSGPAYVFYLVECLTEAGIVAGLPAATAARLARATIEGAGELLFQDAATSPGQLRINVTSPGGTTAAALEVLMAENGLKPLMARAVAAAQRRAGELSG